MPKVMRPAAAAKKDTPPNEVPEPVEPGIPVEEDDLDVEVEESDNSLLETDDGAPLDLEDVDPSEELWPDGPKVGEVIDFKKQYGDIYVTTVPYDKHFLWKTLNRGEYKAVVRRIEEVSTSGEMSPSESNMYQEELVTEMCLLFPSMTAEDFNGELAGVPSLLSQQILESSGFVAVDTRGL